MKLRKKKRGGKVDGKKPHARPDKRARGGLVNDDKIIGVKDTGEKNGDNKQPKTGYASGGRTPRKDFHPGGEKGKLHREMDIPEGQKIPAAKLRAAAHSSDPEKKRDAIRAETMKKWKH